MPKTEAAEARRKMPTDFEFVSGKDEVLEDDEEDEDAAEDAVDWAFNSFAAAVTFPAKLSAGGGRAAVDSCRRDAARSELRMGDGDEEGENVRCWRRHWRHTNDERDSWVMALRIPL
jgi:hypothetical protein